MVRQLIWSMVQSFPLSNCCVFALRHAGRNQRVSKMVVSSAHVVLEEVAGAGMVLGQRRQYTYVLEAVFPMALNES